jgi:hypothetical protein
MKKDYFPSWTSWQYSTFTVIILLVINLSIVSGKAEEIMPVAWWSLDEVTADSVQDKIKNIQDHLSGNFRVVQGVSGSALKFDGYTTMLTRKDNETPALSAAFTIEAWVAIAAYPWSWCPLICHNNNSSGYAFEIGPEGELALKVFSGSAWRNCISNDKINLKKWTHVAGIFDPEQGLTVYIDGIEKGRLEFQGQMNPPRRVDLVIGSVQNPAKPAFIHREYGTLPGWYSLDAIIDEVKIYDKARNIADMRKSLVSKMPTTSPDIPLRMLPSTSGGSGRFGAYLTHLKFYWEWDDLWRVGDHPDIVVQFDDSPVRVVFWRGTRYSPAWVTENNLWMADQSVEAWDNEEGCFEHMQDRHCRYSHVRIIENTPARVVIHWRYAPVSAHDNHWKVNPRTGWGCWIDEYYYIYPDQTGIRKYTWEKGSLNRPRQFQESIPFTGPGQVQGDVINEQYVTVANLKGDKQVFSYIENPQRRTDKTVPENPLIQMHNFKAKNKPFIIFEPGGRMRYLRDMDISSLSRPGSCSHWPIGQMRCDGRTQITTDRATSFLGFPITSPVVHEKANRNWISSLYGMNNQSFDRLVPLARSWIQSPKLIVNSGNVESVNYDFSQRAYILNCKDPVLPEAELILDASIDSPLNNACLVLKGWGDTTPIVKVEGVLQVEGKGIKMGHIRNLEGTDLLLWLERESDVPIKISLIQ